MSEELERTKRGTPEAPAEDLFLRRWSPRAFAAREVTDEQLRSIFTAGAWAASSYNEQPWRFLLGRKGDGTWNGIFDSLTESNQVWAGSAPVLYVSFAKKTFSHNGSPNRVAPHDVGAASAQISLQATALGLHTHGMAGFDAEKLRMTFAFPDDFEAEACWALGYLGEPESLPEKLQGPEKEPRKRKALAEFVFKSWDKGAF